MERNNTKREKIIKNVKRGGSIVMYIGTAGLISPMVRRARETQNGAMGVCSTGAGVVLSAGVGKLASDIFGKVVDKVVDFWDDVKPQKTEESDKKDGENNG